MKDYIIDENGNVVAVPYSTGRAWRAARPDWRIVERTVFGSAMVSTVFLGYGDLGHGDLPAGRGRPGFFETLIFGAGTLDGRVARYATLRAAIRGHARVLRRLAADR